MKVGSYLLIDNDELDEREWRKLLVSLTFVNGNQEVVECYRRIYTRGQVKIPRGAWNLVDRLDYYDRRSRPAASRQDFKVKLDQVEKDARFAGQSACVAAMLEHEQGLIIRPPGTGKSQIVLAFVSQCETPALVIVHTEDILQQWIGYTKVAMPEISIGVIRGQTLEVGQITFATVQTLRTLVQEKPSKFWRQFGAVISDEAHHGAAPSWEMVVNYLPAFYRFGITASETRADGMHPALKFIYGPVIHKQKFSSPVKLDVQPVKTSFYFGYRGAFDWGRMVTALVEDEERNEHIAKIVNEEAEKGNSILVLSRRIEHLERIAALLRVDSEILAAKLRTKAERKRILADFRAGRILVVLATQLADEALDVPRLNRIVLTHPGKHEGRIIQQIGRAIRQFPDKQDAVIYDIIDPRVGVLRRQWNQRKRTYKKNHIHVRFLGRLFK